MAAAILSKDWSKTTLGPIESWPQSLRTTVSLCMASNFPISIAWGPERVEIYNDGYWPICGAKHPHSMGQDFKYGRLAASFGFTSDSPARPQTTWPIAEALRSGRQVLVEHLEQRFGTLHCGPYPEAPKQAIVLPIPRMGFDRLAGVLIAGVSSRLPLDEAYRGFYDLLVF